jgi:hypothetical protein
MQQFVGACWNKIFFGKKLDRIRDECVNDPDVERKPPNDRDPVGADTVL